jgi:DNA (cytosine-5)-methyltransferase 1
VPVAFAIQAGALRTNPLSGPDGVGVQADHAYTLEARAEVQAVCFDTTQVTSPANRSNPQPGDPCHTLAAGAHAPAIAFDSRQDPVSSTEVFGSLGSASPQSQAVAFSCKDYGADAGELSPTLRAMGHGASHANAGEQVAVAVQGSQSGVRINDIVGTLDANYGSRRHNGVMQAMQVRRLTPRECERLQGFPDGHTAVPHKGKPASDGPRYKALGNSWAINCARWVGERIDAVDRIVG